MEEIMQINVLKLFKTAIIQLSNRNQFFKDNSQSDETSILIETELKTLKDELIAINLEVTRFSSRLSELHQVQQALVKTYINRLEEQMRENDEKNFDNLNELERQMKKCEGQMFEVTNEKKRFIMAKFDFINEFLSKSHNIPNLSIIQDVELNQTETEFSNFNQTNSTFISNNLENLYLPEQFQVPLGIPEAFRMKKQCEVCSFFGEFNQATRSRREKLSLCKSCAIFHDNHKKILLTEESLNCSCFYNILKCANKKLECFKYLLEAMTRFEIQEPCAEPSVVKKRKGNIPKNSTNTNDLIKRIKVEIDQQE
ncbi:unnamed protein product [Brachionus calyciflorus]|uniref:Uncharacterized protein n=1 Tax=Brachionus calyciflorus TaxID=104777 RepID=A0A814NCR7_9BILA|nr:unnamed protein product [Brachionus calyciflorus]